MKPLRAKRREVFRIQIAEGAQEKGRLDEILRMAKGAQDSRRARASVRGWIRFIKTIRAWWRKSMAYPYSGCG